MIAYNKTKLFYLKILEKAKQWYARQLLSASQFVTIKERYKVDFYTPNLFIKIGLFLFTWLSVIAVFLLLALIFLSENNTDAAINLLCVSMGIGCILLLEHFIKQRKLYRSGINEALLYAAVIAIACMVGNMFSSYNDFHTTILYFTIVMIPVLAAATIRYADSLVAVALAVGCYTVSFLLILKFGAFASTIMPFAMMVLSVILYAIAKQLKQKQGMQNWKAPVVVFECVALFMFYIAGNYFIIRESGIQYFNLHLQAGEDIPLWLFFHILTALVPLLYMWFGLMRKDRLLLWTGLATTALSAATFKYYFITSYTEILLMVAGLVLMTIAYAAIQYLKTPQYGITFEEEPDADQLLKTNGEALLQARSFGHSTNASQAEHTVEFGGGSSGGGGATNKW